MKAIVLPDGFNGNKVVCHFRPLANDIPLSNCKYMVQVSSSGLHGLFRSREAHPLLSPFKFTPDGFERREKHSRQ